MPTITLKNIPPALYERIRQSAAANRRSINSEILVCIEQALGGGSVDPDAILARARVLREKTAGYVIFGEEFTRAKASGRP